MIDLPRQARDKHRKTQKAVRFSQAYFVTSTPFNWNDTRSSVDFPGGDSCSVTVPGCYPTKTSWYPCATGMGNCSQMACVLQVRKRICLRHFILNLKMIILPRQARDKHRES